MIKVTIVGAGPAGSLLAHYLLRRGQYQIDIYDSRPDPRKISFSKYRTFPLLLSERGLNALRNIGLEEAVKSHGIENTGMINYSKNSKPQELHRRKPILTIDRNTLVNTLLEKLEEKDKNRQVNIYFNSRCIGVDFRHKRLKFKKETKEEITVGYDLLFGADGVRSVVRTHFLNTERFEFEQTYLHEVYKTVYLSRVNDKLGINLEPNKLHSWKLEDGTRLLAMPQPDNTLSCGLVFNHKKNQVMGISTKSEVREFFEHNFPEVATLMSESEAEAFVKRPAWNFVTIRCNRYHQGDSVLIVGDAAHAVPPTIAQGCNSALEDVIVFDRILDEYDDDYTKAIPQFTARRIRDAHTLKNLAENSIPISKTLFVQFVLRRKFARTMNQLFPQFFAPFFLDLIAETTVPYSEILKSAKDWVSKVKKSNHKILESSY
ncbi:MAG: FAD-dependent monooxygenase [Hormoscilla sp. GM7CHS1pb]|nr:FAD-dependent monooxygenase [Hormoscilla sp. GM7CHS1pb]